MMSFRSYEIGQGCRVKSPTRVGTVQQFMAVESVAGGVAQMNPIDVDWAYVTNKPTIGSGTVTSVSVTTANGVSGSVANSTTTPAITISLGAITPSSVAATGNVTGLNLSGTNTGDQTTSNSDSTITVTNGTTNPVISINLSHENTWAAVQTFTNPVVGTQSFGDDSTKAASTAFVQAAINNVLANAPNKVAVDYATTAALGANTYANGSSGVGATITLNANGAITIDGSTPSTGDDILVKDEGSLKNGVYRLTQQGTGSLPAILTRRTDFDTSAEIAAGDSVYVQNGSTLVGSTWQMITTGTITLGTTTMVWTQIAGAGTYAGSNGITLTGSNFSLSTNSEYTYLGNATNGAAVPVENTVLTLGSPGYSPASNTVFGQLTGTVANYRQLVVQNLSNSSSASTDFVATSDNGDDTTHYIDVGINSSAGGAAPFVNANAAYVYTVDTELHIGALGTAGAIRFYNGGGTGSPTLAGSVISGAWEIPTSGAASTPALYLTGAAFTGGTSSTTLPLLTIANNGTTTTAWNTNGGMLGIVVPTGYNGNFIHCILNTTTMFSVNSAGTVTCGAITASSNIQAGSASQIRFGISNGILTSPGAGIIQHGAADASSPVAQLVYAQSVAAGNSSVSGADWSVRASVPTGRGIPGAINWTTGFQGSLASAVSCTISNGSPATITAATHGLLPGQAISFATSGALPTGLTAGTTYYVISAGVAVGSFRVSATQGGSAVNTSSAGSGSHTFSAVNTQQNLAGTVLSIGPSGIGTDSTNTPAVTVSQLWNCNGVAPTAFVVNATDINSASTAVLADFQLSTVTKHKFFKDGSVVHAAGAIFNSTGVTIDSSNRLYGNYLSINSQAGTTYTLQASDCGKAVVFSSGSGVTLTLPNSLSEGFQCVIIQKGAGQVTLSAASGATLNNFDSYTKLAGQKAMATLAVESNSGGASAIYYAQGRMAA